MQQAPHAGTFRYRAFISYSHRDKGWAQWLHRALETYRVPRRLVGQRTSAGVVPRRLIPIFRDRDELASSSDLGHKVEQALRDSANLIVICSPAAAASHWVSEEVRTFRRLGRGERIFCLIVAGEPNAGDDASAQECLSAALRPPPPGDDRQPAGSEPIAADVRPDKDGKRNARLKLIAGLLDLELDQLRRREQQRRIRRLTAIAALALLVMLVTGLLAIDAVIARHAAERRQKQAEALVGFMLGDLNDKLAQVQRLDIMEAVDNKALAYFQSLPATDVTDDALEQRVKAMEKIGSVRLDQGRLPAAMSAFRSAAALSGTLAQAAPDDPARQIAHARVQGFLGMTHLYSGELDAAAQSFIGAQATLLRLDAVARADPQVIFELSSLDNNIGHVLEARGQLDEAAGHYRLMLARCRLLAARAAPRAEWLEHLGEAHNNLGKLALMRGDLLSAIREYAADDRIETRLSHERPADNDQRENMARVRAILGRTLLLAGLTDEAARNLQQGLSTIDGLHHFDPAQTGFKDKVGLYSTQLGRLRRLQGDHAAARVLLARATRTLDELVRHDPSNTNWQQDLGEARAEQAALLLASGQPVAARNEVHAALALLTPLLASQPDQRTLLLATMRANLLLADLQKDAAADRLRQDTLHRLAAVDSGAGDVRLLALQVQALLALHRPDAARPLVQRLWQAGYQEPGFAPRLQQAQIPWSANPDIERRLREALDTAAR
jgi:eukaryotic-like serine/threonine-protein kinase